MRYDTDIYNDNDQYKKGYNDGWKDGYKEGWNDAIKLILKKLGLNDEEKRTLKAQS